MTAQKKTIEDIQRLRVIKHKCETDLVFFARYFFKELKDQKFIVSDHHYEMADSLRKIEAGGNLLINMPPRYGKTEIAVVMWIAQSMARNPLAKFIHLSYSSELALDNSAKVREIVKSEKFQEIWPTKIKPDSDSKAKWYTEQGGGLYATMAGGAITGFGAGNTEDINLFGGAIIIDDPLKPDDARSEVERTKVNERLNSTIKSRRNNRNTPIVIIMQRLHEDDMSGYAMDGGMGEEFQHLCLSARRPNGEPLWPMKHNEDELLLMERADRNVFWSQYMQQPTPADGDVFKKDWFNRYNQLPADSQREMIVHSWDTAYKPKQHNDPSACTVWHITAGGYYMAECVNERMDYPTLRKKILHMADRDSPHAILIEDKASGQSLIQELGDNTKLPIIAIKPEGDKETRARACATMFESGKVYLPHDDHAGLESQLLLFPNAKNDDIVDSVSQFLNWVRTNNTGAFDDYNRMLEELYS